jgi:hypothetical protein
MDIGSMDDDDNNQDCNIRDFAKEINSRRSGTSIRESDKEKKFTK